jgi:DNA-binding NarL/FixJ family response regulator
VRRAAARSCESRCRRRCIAAATETDVIRVFVVDDHAVVRHGLSAFLGAEDDIAVVGDADGGDRALDMLELLDSVGERPHVVLMDLEMEPLDGIESTRAIRSRYEDVEIVVLTSFGETERVRAALEAGASGYLLKDTDVDRIAAAVRAARHGDMQLDAALGRRLVSSLESPREDTELTAREADVLRLLGEGYANKSIARELGISERTTRTHVSRILGKLGLSSRTQAALWIARHGDGAPPQRPPAAS